MSKQCWQLGQLIFDPQRRTLQRAATHCTLEPKQAQLLLLLAQHAGEPVSREQLISEIWQGRVVSESAINRAVSLLRKACARLDPATDYLATIPKLGYCLLPAATLLHSAAFSDTATEAAPPIETAPKAFANASIKTSRYSWPVMAFSVLVLVAGWVWLQFTLPVSTPATRLLIPKPLTSFDGAEFNISSSQDGQLLYHRRDAEGNIQLWLNSKQQDTLLVAGAGHALNGSISPDGRQLVYRHLQGQQCQIMLLSLSPAMPKQTLFDCPLDSEFQASWSPDSQQFYYRLRHSKTQPYLVYRYQIATTLQQQLTLADPDSSNGAIALTVAADGRRLAVASYLTAESSRLSLYLLADGKQPQLQQTTDLALAIVDLTWPAEQPLVLASRHQLYQLTDDGEVQHYFYSQQPVNSVASSQQQLYFAGQQQQANIWRKPLRGGAQATPVIASSRLDILPRVNQQGSDLLFLSTRQGLHQVWRKPYNGPEQLLAALPAPASFTRLSWDYDQGSILFSQQGAVYQLQVASGQLSQLFGSEHQAYVVNGGPDNNSLVYSSNKSGDWQLWLYTLNGKQHRQLTRQGGYSGYLVENTLYFSKYHQDGLWLLNLSTGEEQLLFADFDKINWLNWQLQESSVLYFKPGQGIYRQSLLPDTPAERLLSDSPDLVHHYSVSNQAIYFVKRLPPQGDIYQLPLP